MTTIPTIRVKGGSKGSRIINRADFDPKVHELADASADGGPVPTDAEPPVIVDRSYPAPKKPAPRRRKKG